MSSLNTQNNQPPHGRDANPLNTPLSLPPAPSHSQPGESKPATPVTRKVSFRPRHQFPIHVRLKQDGTVYMPRPDPGDPTKTVEQTIWNHLLSLPANHTHRVAFDQQSVQMKVSGTGSQVDELRRQLSAKSFVSLRMKLFDSEIILYQATTTTGERIALTPVRGRERSRLASKFENQAISRRLVELKSTLLEIVTREEHDHALSHGSYPASTASKLTQYNDSLELLLRARLQSPKVGQPPLWTSELRGAIEFAKVGLNSPYPYLDALLLIIDPQSNAYRAVATNVAFKSWINDCKKCGIFASFSERGRANIALRPIIKRIVDSLPAESKGSAVSENGN